MSVGGILTVVRQMRSDPARPARFESTPTRRSPMKETMRYGRPRGDGLP